MNSKDLQRIHHIKAYCDEVADTIKRYGLGYEIFLNDKDYYKSVSMTIMQIGELSIGLSDEFKNATKSQMPWGAIRSMRNMYAHEYAKMDKLAIWETATMDIPQFSNFCDNIIKQEKELKKPEKATDKPSLVSKVKQKQEEAAKTVRKKAAFKK